MVGLEERIKTLERIVGQAAVPQTATLDLNPRQIRALEFLAREQELTTTLYRQWNRVSRARAQRDLSDLLSRGILARQGVGRGTYYVLAGSDEA
jgi:predicted HTH transcriptional regulator